MGRSVTVLVGKREKSGGGGRNPSYQKDTVILNIVKSLYRLGVPRAYGCPQRGLSGVACGCTKRGVCGIDRNMSSMVSGVVSHYVV